MHVVAFEVAYGACEQLGGIMDLTIIGTLADTIAKRKKEPAEGSYTNALFTGGENKIIKKLGEENAEYIRAFLTGTEKDMAEEASDYIYHLMVSLEYKGVGFDKVLEVLSRRHK